MRKTRLRRWRCRSREHAVWLEVLEHHGLFVYRVRPCWHFLDHDAAPVFYFHGSPDQAGWLLLVVAEGLDFHQPRRARQRVEEFLAALGLSRSWGVIEAQPLRWGWVWRLPRPPPGIGCWRPA